MNSGQRSAIVPRPPPGARTGRPRVYQFERLGDGRLRSESNLIYGRDRRRGTRVKHVLRHMVDDLSREQHGVFKVPRRQDALRLTDEAHELIRKKAPRAVRVPETGTDATYIVDMKRTIGVEGGQQGLRRRQKGESTDLSHIKVVIMEGGEVRTAYPARPELP